MFFHSVKIRSDFSGFHISTVYSSALLSSLLTVITIQGDTNDELIGLCNAWKQHEQLFLFVCLLSTLTVSFIIPEIFLNSLLLVNYGKSCVSVEVMTLGQNSKVWGTDF